MLKNILIRAIFIQSLLIMSAAGWAADPRITITSPTEGAVVRPGDQVTVSISVDPSLQLSVLGIIPNMRSSLAQPQFTEPPYESTMVVPQTWTGLLEFAVWGRDVDGNYISGPTVNVNVVPGTVPDSIEVGETSIGIEFPLNPVRGTSMRTVGVYGNYNGVRRNISASAFGTTYTSTNTAIATVDAEGLVSPTGPGIAYVIASHQGKTDVSQIWVDDPNSTTDLPPIEHTSQVSIAASGFKKHLPTGLFVQELTLRNDGPLPIAFPIELVLMDLPTGVYLANKTSVTKYSITPLGSPYIGVKVDERDFWSPGTTVKVKMNFRNPDGKPITYTPKVYTAESP